MPWWTGLAEEQSGRGKASAEKRPVSCKGQTFGRNRMRFQNRVSGFWAVNTGCHNSHQQPKKQPSNTDTRPAGPRACATPIGSNPPPALPREPSREPAQHYNGCYPNQRSGCTRSCQAGLAARTMVHQPGAAPTTAGKNTDRHNAPQLQPAWPGVGSSDTPGAPSLSPLVAVQLRLRLARLSHSPCK